MMLPRHVEHWVVLAFQHLLQHPRGLLTVMPEWNSNVVVSLPFVGELFILLSQNLDSELLLCVTTCAQAFAFTNLRVDSTLVSHLTIFAMTHFKVGGWASHGES